MNTIELKHAHQAGVLQQVICPVPLPVELDNEIDQQDISYTIIEGVRTALGIKRDDTTRDQDQVIFRFITMHLLKNHTDNGYKDIGKMFNRHHATVINAVRQTDIMLQYDKKFKTKYDQVIWSLGL